MMRVGLSKRFHHLRPDLTLVTRETKETFDATLFHVDEDEYWVGIRYRLLRPMFLTTEDEARRAIDYFVKIGGLPGNPDT